MRTLPVVCDKCGAELELERERRAVCPNDCGTVLEWEPVAPMGGWAHVNLGGGRGAWISLEELRRG